VTVFIQLLGSVKSKNFIEKVMFIAVVTRPRYDANGNCTFDGKIGIFFPLPR